MLLNLWFHHDTQARKRKPVAQPVPGGGGRNEAGVGYVLTDHGWVRLTKFARVGVTAFGATAYQTSSGVGGLAQCATQAFSAQTEGATNVETLLAKVQSVTLEASIQLGASVDSELAHGLYAIAQPCRVEWLSGDELLVILEEMR